MGKVHSHYDNLKVSRMAPQEVIRAAYKALSQKYHPDKNPGDDKAARIMAIINTAYGTLSDPQKRKEHDEWIAAEEWEIGWLEGAHEEGDNAPAPRGENWPGHVGEPRPVKSRFSRNWKWGVALGVGIIGGWIGGVLSAGQPRLQAALASALGGKSELSATMVNARVPVRPAEVPPKADPMADSWAVVKAHVPDAAARPPAIKVMALSQVVLPGAAAPQDCEAEQPTLVAPNGEPWPAQSGYVDGFPIGNKGDDMQLTLDNSNNVSAVFIKVFDLERKSNVRYAYVQPRDTLVVDKLAAGKYEIRYQNLDMGIDRAGCRRK